MPEEQSTQSLEEEIRALEQTLAQRKKEAEAEKLTPEVKEKELFRGALQEHIEHAKERVEKETAEEKKPDNSAIPMAPLHDYAVQTKNRPADSEEQKHREQINALVEIALTKGMLEAVRVARHLGNPHLLDDFHDALIDKYYEKLLQARKISSS